MKTILLLGDRDTRFLTHREFDAAIGLLPSGVQARVVDRLSCSLVGEERNVTAVPGTRMSDLCGSTSFVGFHWCNFGLAPAYADRLAKHGLVMAARADDAGIDAVELPNHPFFLATLFQLQVGSGARQLLHPVIQAFVAAI